MCLGLPNRSSQPSTSRYFGAVVGICRDRPKFVGIGQDLSGLVAGGACPQRDTPQQGCRMPSAPWPPSRCPAPRLWAARRTQCRGDSVLLRHIVWLRHFSVDNARRRQTLFQRHIPGKLFGGEVEFPQDVTPIHISSNICKTLLEFTFLVASTHIAEMNNFASEVRDTGSTNFTNWMHSGDFGTILP